MPTCHKREGLWAGIILPLPRRLPVIGLLPLRRSYAVHLAADLPPRLSPFLPPFLPLGSAWSRPLPIGAMPPSSAAGPRTGTPPPPGGALVSPSPRTWRGQGTGSCCAGWWRADA